MQFGTWVQIIRKERGLDIRTFAEKTGVDPSTISRIEHARTQATLYTAFRICESFSISLVDLMNALDETHSLSFNQNSRINDDNVVTLEDLENFIKAFYSNEDKTREHLVKDINTFIKELHARSDGENKNSLSPFMLEDIDKILFRSSIYQFRLKYPSRIKADTISYLYERGGALTLPDVEVYIRKIRPKRIKSFDALDTASLERIKLSDVLLLDHDTRENGKIAAMYWEVCRFHERFNPLLHHQRYDVEALFDEEPEEREPWEFKLASTYITIYRWYQYLWGSEIRFPTSL